MNGVIQIESDYTEETVAMICSFSNLGLQSGKLRGEVPGRSEREETPQMKVDTEIRHVTKPGTNIFLELGFEPAEAKRLHAASREQINDTLQLKMRLNGLHQTHSDE